MPRTQRHFYLAYEVRSGKDLRPKNTNPVLHTFYKMLNDLVLEKDGVKAVMNAKDPAINERVNSHQVKGSIHLDMDIIGVPGLEGSHVDLNAETESWILRELLNISVIEDNIRIAVMDVSTSPSFHEHPEFWPKNMIPVVVSF